MPLTWDVTEIKDYETVTTHPNKPDEWHPVTQALIWLALACDFGSITEKNWQEVYIRIHMQENANGPMRTETYITPDDVRRHIGLRTNVSTTTMNQYRIKLAKFLEREAQHALRQFLEKETDSTVA